MDDLIEEMNTYYARRAPWHDTYMGYTSNEAMEELLRPVIEWFEPKVSDRDVLEVACGTGNWTQVLSRRARSVVATDINPSVIEVARGKTYARGNVSLQVADGYNLDRVPGLYDVVFAADWWSHIPRHAIPRFILCLVRKLRPGSKVILIDMLWRSEFDQWFSHYDADGNRIDRRTLPDGGVFTVVKNFPSESELRKVFGGVADAVDYAEHKGLLRWMFCASIAETDGAESGSAPGR